MSKRIYHLWNFSVKFDFLVGKEVAVADSKNVTDKDVTAVNKEIDAPKVIHHDTRRKSLAGKILI